MLTRRAGTCRRSWAGGTAYPKHTKILMPALSPTMVSGNLEKWVKNVGDTIAPGDVLASIETDKATMDFESQEEGVLAKILVKSGTANVPVNKVACCCCAAVHGIPCGRPSYRAESQHNGAAPLHTPAHRRARGEEGGRGGLCRLYR